MLYGEKNKAKFHKTRRLVWQVPAYPLPEGAKEVTVQRIVCRADLTSALTEAFINDFEQCLNDLKEAHVLCNEKKSGRYGFTY